MLRDLDGAALLDDECARPPPTADPVRGTGPSVRPRALGCARCLDERGRRVHELLTGRPWITNGPRPGRSRATGIGDVRNRGVRSGTRRRRTGSLWVAVVWLPKPLLSARGTSAQSRSQVSPALAAVVSGRRQAHRHCSTSRDTQPVRKPSMVTSFWIDGLAASGQ
jgi:hypothetical protein